MTPPNTPPARLILASTSRYRKALLERFRLSFDVVAPRWNEVRFEDPDRSVRANAAGKAQTVAADFRDAAVLGSDQVAWCDGRILEKPGTEEAAREQLAWLSGREHRLHTSVLLRMPDGTEREQTVVARLRLRRLTPGQIATYVRRENPLDCAGSYKIEGLGIALFDYFDCEDPTAVEGLPLIATRRLLED
ncbi:MAG: septum formation protein Maf, partial [Candidatus Eisenbacteria bacterium]|nr:septum formation protein Maf [Candidatus Latescibacterota bacterium]MBD3302126.1 septum formation protein Maf [Candidatus Eisenbacteria bacterium]